MKQSRNIALCCTIIYTIVQALCIAFERLLLFRISSPVGTIALACPMFSIPTTIFHVIALLGGYLILNKARADTEFWMERRLIIVYRVILIGSVVAVLTFNHLLFDPRQFGIYEYASYLSFKAFGQVITLPFLLLSYIFLLTSAAQSMGAKEKG